MKLDCYLPEGADLDIRPASARRRWMDETPQSYAYRCLPLRVANEHGWEIRCPVSFEAEWDGGIAPRSVRVFIDESEASGSEGDGVPFVESHFGSGILTFNPMGIFRTAPNTNLWVTGPPNWPKDGLQPLSALVETDWLPYNFTMNWKFTRPDTRIRFERGEPYCFLFPVPRGVVERCDPRIAPIDAEPGLGALHQRAFRERTFLGTLRASMGEERLVKNDKALRFQGWYMAGENPDGSPVDVAHQVSIEAKPFRRSE